MIRPVTLVILDGFAFREETHGNAVALARTPVLTDLLARYPHTHIATSGRAVGLPTGQMGNSEVGHQNMGAGRVVYQDLTRIDVAIEDGSFPRNETLVEACERAHPARRGSGRLHLMGLVSDGGVHSSFEHLKALIDLAAQRGVPQVFVHAFTDGRDTAPKSGEGFLRALAAHCAAVSARGTTKAGIATVIGRYFAMDRDMRWDRVRKAWDAMVHGIGKEAADPIAAVTAAYVRGETDEFIEPTVVDGGAGKVRDGDSVVFFNFRADRARELTWAFTKPGFADFDTGARPALAGYATMTRYEKGQEAPAAFPPQVLSGIMGELIAGKGLKQLRIAETEKYAHVTYFFNGGEEKVFPGEERILIPSPRDVATYDLKPEMNARAVTEAAEARLAKGDLALTVLNFANPDMVGHTGVLPAAIKAVETIDACIGRIVAATRAIGGVTMITADHGNVEEMIDENGQPFTQHTTRDVPLIVVDDTRIGKPLVPGALQDIAPTALAIMGLERSPEMTGRDLFGGA